jgi:tetratricopeptide (TPR) repeat protein
MKNLIIILCVLLFAGIHKTRCQTAEDLLKKYNEAYYLSDKIAYINKLIAIKYQPMGDLYHNRALHKDAMGLIEEAMIDYDSAIMVYPIPDADTYNRRGLLYRRLFKNEEALRDFDKSLNANPEKANSYNNRGLVKYDLGKYQEALADYDKALSFEIHPSYYNNRGMAYLRLGKYQKAINDFTEAIELNSDYHKAKHNREFAKIALAEQKAKSNPLIVANQLTTYHKQKAVIMLSQYATMFFFLKDQESRKDSARDILDLFESRNSEVYNDMTEDLPESVTIQEYLNHLLTKKWYEFSFMSEESPEMKNLKVSVYKQKYVAISITQMIENRQTENSTNITVIINPQTGLIHKIIKKKSK